jgi:hypothetical protein
VDSEWVSKVLTILECSNQNQDLEDLEDFQD